MHGNLSFKGLYCSAGKKVIIIDPDGTIKRCYDEDIYLGNIFEGKLKLLDKNMVCNANTCHCPYFGLKYASGKPRITTISPRLERFVYPYTTPMLKPIRRVLQKLSYKDYQRN